jgi:hypothetical protein
LILACVFGNSPEFWLNVQRRSDLWKALDSPLEASSSSCDTPWLHEMPNRMIAVSKSSRHGWCTNQLSPANPLRSKSMRVFELDL